MNEFFANLGQHMTPILFGALPYVALVIFFLVTIQRYRSSKFTYSSLSSQFLENKMHFWGMVPFHYGILIVTAGHVIAFLFPKSVLMWNQVPVRLFILEATALIAGILTLVGMINTFLRRSGSARLRVVTSPSDWILYALLFVQVGSGIYVALFHRWGSSWFAASMSPYLWSLVKLNPILSHMEALPFAVKLHVVNAWLLIGFFPFTRLVHVLVVPNQYLMRKAQVVRWNWDRNKIRKAE